MGPALISLEGLSPLRYLEKVSRISGAVLCEPIQPSHLLVDQHRDHYVIDILARWYLSRVAAATRNEQVARRHARGLRRLAAGIAGLIGAVTGCEPARVGRALFGLERQAHSFRFKKFPLRSNQAQSIHAALQARAAEQLASVTDPNGGLRLKVLLTGGTGFLGKEIIWQAAHDPDIAELIVLIRPKEVIDRNTGKVKEVLTPARRGEELLRQLSLDGPAKGGKIRFVAGDVEQPNLGIDEQSMLERGELKREHSEYYKDHLLPLHSFVRVLQTGPTLRISALDPEWFENYLKKNPSAIRHETVKGGWFLDKHRNVPPDRIILTASPRDLQRFLLTHIDTEGVAAGVLQPTGRPGSRSDKELLPRWSNF